MVDITVNAAPRTILLKGRGQRYEAIAGGTITPGALVNINSSGQLVVHATAGQRAARWFALENELVGLGIDDNYVVNDFVQSEQCGGSQWVLGLLAAHAAALVIGDYVESAGDGTLRKLAAAGVKATVTSAGADANGNIIWTARVAGQDGNDIQVVLAAAGSASVVVAGKTITVTPASGSNTATAVVAQIAANGPAANLVTAVANGTGASAPGTSTVVLVGGEDAAELAAAIGQVMVAVDNSAAAVVGRVQLLLI